MKDFLANYLFFVLAACAVIVPVVGFAAAIGFIMNEVHVVAGIAFGILTYPICDYLVNIALNGAYKFVMKIQHG